MRRYGIVAAVIGASAASPAAAATIVIYQDPLTLDRRTVVIGSKGPDRAYWCMLPPSEVGCRELPVKRGR